MELTKFKLSLKKISFYQLAILTTISLIFFIFKMYNYSSALLIAGLFSMLYTQLLLFSAKSNFLTLFGFPIRLLIVAPPVAILVHKLNANLLALFIGFVISLTVYIVVIWLENQKDN